jgi:hypothetical protein
MEMKWLIIDHSEDPMSKISTLVVAAAAYVLGARAGRERYEQIRSGAQRFWSDPRVQSAASEAKGTVADKAPHLKDRAADALKQTANKAKSATGRTQSGAEAPDAVNATVSNPVGGSPGVAL